MKQVRILLLVFSFFLPINLFGQRAEVLLNLNKAYDKAKEAIELTVKSIENMTDAYKHINSTSGKRFVVLIKNNLSEGIVVVKAAHDSTKRAQIAAEHMNCLPAKETACKVMQLFSEAEAALSDALNYTTQAREATDLTEVDQLLKQAIPPIERAVKNLNKTLDLLSEAAEQLNTCAD